MTGDMFLGMRCESFGFYPTQDHVVLDFLSRLCPGLTKTLN